MPQKPFIAVVLGNLIAAREISLPSRLKKTNMIKLSEAQEYKLQVRTSKRYRMLSREIKIIVFFVF